MIHKKVLLWSLYILSELLCNLHAATQLLFINETFRPMCINTDVRSTGTAVGTCTLKANIWVRQKLLNVPVVSQLNSAEAIASTQLNELSESLQIVLSHLLAQEGSHGGHRPKREKCWSQPCTQLKISPHFYLIHTPMSKTEMLQLHSDSITSAKTWHSLVAKKERPSCRRQAALWTPFLPGTHDTRHQKKYSITLCVYIYIHT